MSESLLVQLRKGVLDLCVLALLARSDGYAYDIASRLAEEIGMGEGTIYPPRKYYQLTKAGHDAFASQKTEWKAFTVAVGKVLSDNPSPSTPRTPGAAR